MEDFYVTISTSKTESTTHLATPKILDKSYKVGLVSLYMNIPELYGNITVTYYYTSITHIHLYAYGRVTYGIIHLFYINNLIISQKL